SDTTVNVSDGTSVGVGDVLIADAESMVVADSAYADTTVTFSGLSTAQASDNQVGVPSGAAFAIGEVVQVDSEWLLIQNISGNNLIVKRAWDGSVLAGHTGGTIWARRVLSVLRGQLGTMAATHTTEALLSVNAVPGLVHELAIAEAIDWLTQEPSAYSAGMSATMTGWSAAMGQRTMGQQKEPMPGIGLYDLRQMVMNSRYCRKARSRVI
ncbi:MAG: hypothetical protein ACREBQ_13185, partial [Nitrososphaerales archaeon]